MVDYLGPIEGVDQRFKITYIAFDNLDIQSLQCSPVYMDQSTGRSTLSQQGTYKVSAHMSGGTGYYNSHLPPIISYVTKAHPELSL